MGETPLDKMIRASVGCVICGAAMGACSCWSKCAKCGWSYRTGEKCRRCDDPNSLPQATHAGRAALGKDAP